ncbi:transcriptional regulator [Caulobacter phage CcrColossus]|uniref:Uncharacterized protein n=1 Tax=Caulobacter phage CcrColossus TaxID=1211640 RepID=K4JV21_9CAUD|nr:transcriptional regulator [Caulobacter phage CcrColossus]AFU88210.1 hypothetical protein CcrColossus_gp340 [Caulobacter phage CcrColossus]
MDKAQRIRLAIDTARPAWIEKTVSGDHYIVVTKGTLFPLTKSVLQRWYKTRAGAVNLARREGLTILEGECPFDPPTDEQVKAYHARDREKRNAAEQVMQELDVPFTEAWRALTNLEAKGLIRFG